MVFAINGQGRLAQRTVSLVLAAAAVGALVLASDPAQAVDNPTVNLGTPDTRLQNARAAIAAGDWQRALLELNIALELHPDVADVHNLLGYTWRKQPSPDLSRALFYYRRALQIDPTHRGAHEYIGEAYLTLGQPEQARAHLATLRQLCGPAGCEEEQYLALALKAYEAARPATPQR